MIVLTAASTFFLIIVGALVVGHDAGLAVPDWPLSFGTWMPPMVGGVFYEHGHRMVAATVGLLTIALALWLTLREPRRWVRALAWTAVAAVIVQAILGGLTVIYRLPAPIVIAHACLAQIFFCILLTLALATSRHWDSLGASLEDRESPQLRHLTAALSVSVLAQLALGAALRHRALDVLPHLLWAALVTVLGGWVVLRCMRMPERQPLQRLAVILGSLLVVQVALGGLSYLARATHEGHPSSNPAMVWTTTLHVAIGALVLGVSWLLTLLVFRRTHAPFAGATLARRAEKNTA
jgi:cytochrome c oxidase assembly protein subunit 15